MKTLTIESILEEFREKSSDFINGRLSPFTFDEWLESKLHALVGDVPEEFMLGGKGYYTAPEIQQWKQEKKGNKQ